MPDAAVPKKSPLFFHAMAMCTITLWSFSYLFIVLIGHELSPMTVAVSRHFVFAIFIAALLIWKRPPIHKLTMRQWAMLILLGLVGGPMYHITFAWAAGRTPDDVARIDPGLLGLILATVPVYTSVLAWIFLRERINWQTMVAIMCGITGVVIVLFGKHGRIDLLPREALEGPIAATFAAMIGGAVVVITRGCRSIFGPVEVVGVAGVFMVLFSALATPLADLSTVGELTTRGMLALGYLGICGSGVAFLTWAAALQGLKATVVAMYLFLASILAALWSWIFLGQAVGWAFFPGAGLVLFGLLLVASAGGPQREAAKSVAS